MAVMPDLLVRVKTVTAEVQASAVGLMSGGLFAGFFNFFQGRCTFFALVFLLMGLAFAATAIWGFLHGKDIAGLASVITAMAVFMGALQAMLLAHSTKEDWNVARQRQLDIQQQSVSATPPATPGLAPPIQA